MPKENLVIVCSLKAYEEIHDFLMNSSYTLPSRKFKIDDKGYFYYLIEDIDGIFVETIKALEFEIARLNKLGEYAKLN